MDFHALDSNTSISVSPNHGANIVSWICEGIERLHPSYKLSSDPFSGGIPVLFPAVGRTYRHRAGKVEPEIYTLSGADAEWNMPIHGFVARTQWRKGGVFQSRDLFEVEYSCQSTDDDQKRYYPFPFRLSLTYTLRPQSLSVKARIHNLGNRALPFALGFHPYFAIRNMKTVKLHISRGEELELDPNLSIPTGKTRSLDSPLTFCDADSCDAVYAGCSRGDVRLCSDGREISIFTDDDFDLLVIYKEKHAPYLCVEPWTRGFAGFAALADGPLENSPMPLVPPEGFREMGLSFSARSAT